MQTYAEIVATPLTLWLGPIATPFPAIDAATSAFNAAWVQVGSNGALDYDPTGLTVTHNQTMSMFQPVGTTAPIRAWRTAESLEIALVLADISPIQYSQALNDATITTVAASTGIAGEQDFPLLQGINVATYALLARGVSGLNPNLNAQYSIPCVYQSANPAPVYKLGTPAELALTFTTLLDPNGGGFGNFQQQSAARL